MSESDLYSRIQDTRQHGPAKQLVLCADDYALNEPVSEAIMTLLAYGRISVTSCMTGSPLWPEHGARLRDAGMAQRAGLHFNLTHPFPGAISMPLGRLMLACRLGLMDARIALAALQRQLDDYEDVMLAPPAFVDGHQHVHVFHGLRDMILTELGRRYAERPWIRALSPLARPYPNRKTAVLWAMGATLQEPRLHAEGWRYNHSFGGLYALRPGAGFSGRMPAWLHNAADHGLIMCHPATAAQASDKIGPARVQEYAWLKSEAWPAALKAAHVTLVDAPQGQVIPAARIEVRPLR